MGTLVEACVPWLRLVGTLVEACGYPVLTTRLMTTVNDIAHANIMRILFLIH